VLLEAPEADGLAVTVLVTVGVVDWLADDEQPATARQRSAAAEAAPENTALENTACPSSTRRLARRPAIMTTERASRLAPHRNWVYGGSHIRRQPPADVSSALVWVAGAVADWRAR
jgi:hypothetical protein